MDIRSRRPIRRLEEPRRIEVELEDEPDDDNVSHSSYSEDDAFMKDESEDRMEELNCSLSCSPEKSECDINETPTSSPKRIITLSSSEDRNKSTRTDNGNNEKVYLITVLVVLIAVIAGVVGFGTKEAVTLLQNNQCNTKDDFSKTNSDIWINLKSGINEVKNMHKPSVFLYIYNSAPEDYIDELVKNLSAYASCSLNGTDDPIELTNYELNSSRAHSNYGHILEKYRNELVLKKVMVVKHLELVPGVVAQIFHSFCDEVTPLVANSLFLFTMKVDRLKDTMPDYRIVEEVLRRNWSDLDDDIFDPLLTRISNMILRINKSPAL